MHQGASHLYLELTNYHLFSKVSEGSADDESEVEDDLLWDDMTINNADSPISGALPPAGAPFSALTPSIWPQDILARIQQVYQLRCHLIMHH